MMTDIQARAEELRKEAGDTADLDAREPAYNAYLQLLMMRYLVDAVCLVAQAIDSTREASDE